MIGMTLAEIAAVVDGSVVGLGRDGADSDLLVSGAAFLDSRDPVPNGLFVAFDGEGKARLLSTPNQSQDDMVHDLHLLLSLGTKP